MSRLRFGNKMSKSVDLTNLEIRGMRAGRLVAFAAACANAFQTSNPTSSAYTRLIAALGELDGAKLDSLSVNEEGRLVADGGGGNGGAGDLFPGDVSDAYHANTHVVLALPRSAALTAEELRTGRLAHFVDSPAFRKHLTKQKLFVPSTFIFTLFFLYQQYAGSQPHAEPVWQAWLDYHVAARTGEHSLFFWSPVELEVIEEKRMVDAAKEFREQVGQHYEKLMRPIMDAFPRFFPRASIGEREFLRALAIASATQVRIDGLDDNETAIVPLPLRQHPSGTVSLEEVEQERMSPSGATRSLTLLHLVGAGGRLPKRGEELTLRNDRRHNAELLLEAGYIWNDVKAASVAMRLSLPETLQDESTAAPRIKLLKQAKLNATQDFSLKHGSLPPKLFEWSRITLCSDDEIERARGSADELAKLTLSEKSENDVASSLLRSLQGLRTAYDHEIEEDDALLDAPQLLSKRQLLAVQHRRLSKMVLDDVMTRAIRRVNDEFDAEEKRKRDEKAKAAGGASKGYSSKKERQREEAARRKKEMKREEVRRRRQEAEAAEAAGAAAAQASP